MPRPPKFDKLLNEGVQIHDELAARERRPKLTAGAFVETAMKNAAAKPADLDALEERIGEFDEVARFVRRLTDAFCEANYPVPPPAPKFQKFGRVYGDPELDGQLARAGTGIGVAVALAARAAAARAAGAFGDIEDWTAHTRRCRDLRARLGQIHSELRGCYTAPDIVMDDETMTLTQRRDGLARMRFRRAPTVNPGQPDWPVRLVEHVAAQAMSKTKAA